MTGTTTAPNSGELATTKVAVPIFSHDVFARDVYGGVSRYIASLHAEFRRRGVPSTVLAPLYKSAHLDGVDRVVGTRIPDALHVRGSGRIAWLAGRLLEPASLRALARKHRDVVLHRTYYSPVPPPASIPSVITVHDMIHETWPDQFSPRDRTIEGKRLWCARVDVIIAVSHHTKSELVRILDVDPEKVTVCHHGVERTDPDLPTLERLSRERPFLLYVGNRGGYKNFDRLVAALMQTGIVKDGIRLIAFGKPPSPVELASVRRLDTVGAVSFAHGDDAALAAHYASARALVYPSLSEGFGLPPLEAMLHGCPVAASTGGAIPEVVGDAALLFDPADQQAIAEALDRVVRDEQARSTRVKLGAEHAANFTWSVAADATAEVYASALFRERQ
jgi:glycosyltransferase involved in cell wall biosynthesis